MIAGISCSAKVFDKYFAVAMSIWVLALLPILITPWIGDDMAYSIGLRDAVVSEALTNGLDHAIGFMSQGRVAFLHLVMLNFVYAIFKNVYAYKSLLVLINLFPFLAFNKLCKTLGLNSKEFLLMAIILVATVQLRGSTDPYVSFFGMVQCCTGFMLLSINSFLKDKSWSAAIWAALALQFYEVGYVLLPIFFAISVARLFIGQSLKLRTLIASVLVITSYLIASIVLRKLAVTNGGAVEYAYSFVFEPWKIMQTIAMQMAGALPLDYLMLTDRSGNSGVDIKTAKVLWFFLLACVVFFPIYMFFRIKRSERWQDFADRCRPISDRLISNDALLLLFVVGLLLWVLPGAIIAVSPKYQGEGLIRWSQPYLPAYTATYGVSLVLYGVYAWFVRKYSNNKATVARFMPVFFVFVAAVSNLYNWNNAVLLQEAWGKQYPVKDLVWSEAFKHACSGLVYTADKMYWTDRLLSDRKRSMADLPAANLGPNDCILITTDAPRFLSAQAYINQ